MNTNHFITSDDARLHNNEMFKILGGTFEDDPNKGQDQQDCEDCEDEVEKEDKDDDYGFCGWCEKCNYCNHCF